jgi:hypothetical protein
MLIILELRENEDQHFLPALGCGFLSYLLSLRGSKAFSTGFTAFLIA